MAGRGKYYFYYNTKLCSSAPFCLDDMPAHGDDVQGGRHGIFCINIYDAFMDHNNNYTRQRQTSPKNDMAKSCVELCALINCPIHIVVIFDDEFVVNKKNTVS